MHTRVHGEYAYCIHPRALNTYRDAKDVVSDSVQACYLVCAQHGKVAQRGAATEHTWTYIRVHMQRHAYCIQTVYI